MIKFSVIQWCAFFVPLWMFCCVNNINHYDQSMSLYTLLFCLFIQIHFMMNLHINVYAISVC